MTTYIVTLAVPGSGDDTIEYPVDDFADVLEAFFTGCEQLVREHGRFGDPAPVWTVTAVEADGEERRMTRLEEAALTAQWEQADQGRRATIHVS